MTVLRARGFVDYKASKAAKRILRGAVEGLAPFRAKTINLMHDYDIDFNRYRLLVEAVGADWVVVGEIYIDRDALLESENYEQWSWKAREETKLCLRNRKTWPVEDHIELGEN